MLGSMSDQEAYVEAVLAIVEQIPEGRATTYGLIAEAVGRGGPRSVGRVMALYGGSVPWWRVVRAGGGLPQCHQREATPHYRAEGTPMTRPRREASPIRVDLATCGWDPSEP